MNEGDLRIPHAVDRGPQVVIFFDDEALPAYAGENLAAALLAAGRVPLRASPRGGGPRGLFCAMGICQECVVLIDGRPVPSCLQPVRDGMRVFAKRYA